jgi:hypothetical protein
MNADCPVVCAVLKPQRAEFLEVNTVGTQWYWRPEGVTKDNEWLLRFLDA